MDQFADYLRRAEEAEQKAAETKDGVARAMYLEAAEQWRAIAAAIEDLRASKRQK
jgi:hypothetical protein